jgi:hypothetical protein
VCIAFVFGHALSLAPSAALAKEVRAHGDLDGIYVTLGPVAAGTYVDDVFTMAAGLELSVVRVTEHRIPAALGISGGGLSYGARQGGRLWAEVEAALADPLPFGLGLSVGVGAEVDPVRRPRMGAQGTLWLFAGVVPYLRLGTLAEVGTFVEAGIMLKLPALRL